jgi:hypothetical protein
MERVKAAFAHKEVDQASVGFGNFCCSKIEELNYLRQANTQLL